MAVNLIFLIVMVLGGLWAVMTRSLLRSAIALAFTSALVAVLMFKLNSPLAAVFELSVCTGLISVLFISTISLTHPRSQEQILEQMKERFRRFGWLPFIVLAIGVIFCLIPVKPHFPLLAPESQNDARIVLWDVRRLDMIGQVIILLSGVFGVVMLFRDSDKK